MIYNQNENNLEKHKKTKKTLKIVGIIMLVVGAGLTITGLVSFFSAMGTSNPPKLFWCAFVGFILLGIGGSITALGFQKEMKRYIKNESVPIFNEMGQEIKTGVTAMTQTINDTISDKKIICRCGEENEQGSKFCSKCGSPLIKTCPNCHNEIETNDNFCNKCGTKLD